MSTAFSVSKPFLVWTVQTGAPTFGAKAAPPVWSVAAPLLSWSAVQVP